MKLRHLWLSSLTLIAFAIACGGDDTATPSRSVGSGTAGNAGSGAVSGNSAGFAGALQSGGLPSVGGMSLGGHAAASGMLGGSFGTSGSSSGAGFSAAGGAGTSGGSAGFGGGPGGGFGGTNHAGAAFGGVSGGSAGAPTSLKGGASAKFVCAPGETYGNPLTGMGAVVTISAPSSGPATYFAFIEGPVWIQSLGKLFFSDNASSPAERIWQLVPPSTTPSVFMDMSGSNGLAIDSNDKLILADQRGSRIVRVDPTSAMVMDTVVPMGSFKPNDLIVRSDGNLYFTDPATGFYRSSPTGTLTGPFKDVSAPNGLVLSPDENTLYVGDVNARLIRKFPLMGDGSFDAATSSLFATTFGGTVDGMAIDCAGNVYAGTQVGVEVYTPTGSLIGTVPTGESSNCTFGGADRKTLYVTSRSVLKAVTVGVPGLPD